MGIVSLLVSRSLPSNGSLHATIWKQDTSKDFQSCEYEVMGNSENFTKKNSVIDTYMVS
jgi:hypothetical protein